MTDISKWVSEWVSDSFGFFRKIYFFLKWGKWVFFFEGIVSIS